MDQFARDEQCRSIRGCRPQAKTRVKCAVLAALVCCTFAQAAEPLPAFPGAEGFGASARGGRGGRVIKVREFRGRLTQL